MSHNIPNNLSSAYSDDGKMRSRMQASSHMHEHTADVNIQQQVIRQMRPSALEGEEVLASVQAEAELSNRGEEHRQRPDEEAISEQPDETEDASSPPGTIGDRDIMSEHIQTNFGKFRKGKNFNGVDPDFMDDGVSEEAHKSTVTKVSKVAEVSPMIAIGDTSRSIQGFNLTYDRLFAEFQQKLVEKYTEMRQGYMSEFQDNFNQNSSRRDDKISEMLQSIEYQENYIKELDKSKEQQKSCLAKFHEYQRNAARFRIVIRAWRYYAQCHKRKKRIQAYIKNKLHRRRQRLMFASWRQVVHEEFKEKLETEKHQKRMELESKMLVKWSNKVDALYLYMQQLEDKIKVEQEAREKLARTYDQSLNLGFSQLNLETKGLSHNPLVNEVVIKHCDE